MDIASALIDNLYMQAIDPWVLIPALAAGTLAKSKKITLLICLAVGCVFVAQSLFMPLPPGALRLPWIAPVSFIVPLCVGAGALFCKTQLRRLAQSGQKSLLARIGLSFGSMVLGATLCGSMAFGSGLIIIDLADVNSNDNSALYTLALVVVPLAVLAGGMAGFIFGWNGRRKKVR